MYCVCIHRVFSRAKLQRNIKVFVFWVNVFFVLNDSAFLLVGFAKVTCKTAFFICHCARLSIPLDKVRCGSAMSNEIFVFICHCARLSLPLNKVRCGSVMSNEIFVFICHCARLSLPLNKVRCGSAMSNEIFVFICHCARLSLPLQNIAIKEGKS